VEILGFANYVFDNLHLIWTFLLLVVRFTGMFLVIPGIGGGEKGLKVRIAATLALALASLHHDTAAELPPDWFDLIACMVVEFVLGMAVGLVPAMVIAGVQTGAQLATTTMGLGASQLIDPTSGTSVSSLARIFGDLAVLVFLLTGGHYFVIYALSGLGTEMVPGSFKVTELTVDLLVQQSANIFTVGVMISAPVIVALLLTQFVMGLISKAVPTVNIFIVSFPLTIGIGLILSVLVLPDMIRFLGREYVETENMILNIMGSGIL